MEIHQKCMLDLKDIHIVLKHSKIGSKYNLSLLMGVKLLTSPEVPQPSSHLPVDLYIQR